jgi:hypothetical protein
MADQVPRNQVWEFAEFFAPNGAEQAVQFLNEGRYGAGQVASATLRNDGSAGLIYLTPPSLGTSTSQTWVLKQLPGPDGAQLAVQLLNAADRQGPGEASATVRGEDSSAGLIFLAPGSQGTSTSQTWLTTSFSGPDGAQQAVQFLNEAERQGPGQAIVTPHSDGEADLIFLGPGSLGTSAEPTWVTKEFPGPNGAQDAVAFLNQPLLPPGPGEVVGFMPGEPGNDSAVIFYLAFPTGIINP